MIKSEKEVIVHSVSSWLPQTMTWLYSQVKNLDAFSSIVISNTTQNLDQFPWNPIYTVQAKYRSLTYKILTTFKMKRYGNSFDSDLRRHRPRILHSHFADRGWLDLEIARRHGLNHVVSFYGYDVNMLPIQQVWKERYKTLFESADLFLCEGPHMAECIVDLGCPREKVAVQRLGIETDKIPFVPRLFRNGNTLYILIAGTFREKKGIPYALEAVAALAKEYPNMRVTIVGDSSGLDRDEQEKRAIHEVIRRHKLEAIVRLVGFQPYPALMRLAYEHHFFLSPSVTSSDGDTEGGAPVTVIEMAASGMPIISTNHCDIPFVLSEINRGHLVPERDTDGLVNAMLSILQMTDAQLLELISENRAFIENELDIKTCVRDLSDKYKTLLN